MEKIMDMSAALLDFVSNYADDNGVSSAEALASLAHTYVIYGFAVKKDDTTNAEMKEFLVGYATLSADHMMEMKTDEKA